MAKAAALTLLWLLLGLPILTSPVFADPDTVKWSKVNIPTQGKPGGWVLASGSDAQHLTMASDGTLYAYGKGLTYTLYQSTDGGYSWSAIGKVKDAIVDIAIAPDNVIYYATSSQVYKSVDGVSKFAALPSPGGAGVNNIEITSLDVARLNNNIIVVGTRDTDNVQYGGIYLLDEANLFTWTDTSLGNYDVYSVALSPNYPGDHQLVAVVSNETDTFITTNFGGGGWGTTIANAKIDNLVPVSASIAFPEDYDPSIIASYFVAIDSGLNKGDAYRVENSIVTDLNIGAAYNLSNVDVTGLAVSGDTAKTNLIAGAAASAEVYFSPDGGRNWQRSTKPPTGQSKTYVVMASGKAYATTSGADSAFSYTTDGGITWNQTSLINTTLSDIVDPAPSPNSQDNAMFMLTFGSGEDSLWRNLNGGTTWERVLSSSLADIDTIDRVRLPPQYSSDNQIVFIAGTSNGNEAIWKSTDNGQTFGRRIVPFPIDAWAVVDNTTLFIGSFDAATNTGLVYRTTNSGSTYSEGAVAGSQSLNSIALSPDYGKDETIQVGNKDGWVFWSEDNGISFEALGEQLPELIADSDSNSITVAFDPKFSNNNTVYAASHCRKTLVGDSSAIYRFIIGKSDSWENIDSPAGGMIGQLLTSPDSTLYAINSKANGGMERCLNPTYPLGPTFETVTKGLDDGATLIGLWLCDNQLWSIDSSHTSLMSYTDSLAQPVILTSPRDKAAGVGTIINYTIKNATIDWETLEGAIEYKWQLNYDTDFSSDSVPFEGDTRASSAQLPALDPVTTYYWRVRATEPVLSRWSDKWSFTTSFGTEAYAPELDSPQAAAIGVPVKPIFQWSAIAGADGYELVVSTEADIHNPTILKTGTYALPTTAWQANIELNYNTTYYWKVRAVSSNTYSPWSAVSAFTTEPPPSLLSTPEPPQPPSPTTFNWTEWLVPLGGVLLLTFLLIMITMLITMIILTVKVLKL
jgi:photosystem II stability/assembly factor-like uncharacterized protein